MARSIVANASVLGRAAEATGSASLAFGDPKMFMMRFKSATVLAAAILLAACGPGTSNNDAGTGGGEGGGTGGGVGGGTGGGTGGGAGGGGGTGCPGSQTMCTAGCVDTSSDPANCGTCDHACATTESCISGQCQLTCGNGTLESGESCDDGNAVSGDGCSAICVQEATFTCTGTPSVCVSDCGGASAIDDNDVCTSDSCNANTGQPVHTPVSVDDGDPCTNDLCTTGAGITHTPVVVDDGDLCTVDACNATTGAITHTPLFTDDGDACTTDACDPNTGNATHTPVTVDDMNACTTDACDSASGSISHVPVSTDDSNACTADACDPTNGVTHTPVNPDDNNVCTTDACDPATGVSHTAVSVDDQNACTADSCDPVNGPQHAPVNTDDNNVCTTDSCDPTTGVTHTAVSVDDNNLCTNDSCDPTTGIAHTPVSTDDQNACTADSCNPSTGVTHTPVSTDDNIACTTDACDPSTGVSHTPDNSVCTGQYEVCVATAGCQVPALAQVVVTEFKALGNEFIELYNPGTTAGSIRGFTVVNGGSASATIFAASDPTGSSNGEVIVPAGGYLVGVPNPSNASAIPTNVQFVYGLPGTGFNFADTGDSITIKDRASATLDTVNFSSFVSAAGASITTGQFPGSATASTQLDPTALTATGNDSGDKWCLSWRAADTMGAANVSCTNTIVINESLYDFQHPTLLGTDDGYVFVELAGPPGALLTGLTLQGTNNTGTTVSSSPAPNFTFAAGLRIPLDGIFVIADGVGTSTTSTNVPNADLILANCDPVNGSSGNLLRLRAGATGPIIDTIAYGPGATGENNTSAPVLGQRGTSFSVARDLNSTDTNDSAAELHNDPTPSPGLPNAPVQVVIKSRSIVDSLATGTASISIVATDVARFSTVNGTAPADNDFDIQFASQLVPATDTTASSEGCTIVDVTNAGRGDTVITCTVPSNNGTVQRGAFSITNPAAIGGSALIPNGWTYTGVLNETDLPGEADFCNLQFPATMTSTQGTPSPIVYGQIYEAGVTEAPGAAAGVKAQLGYGAAGSNPTTTNWPWTDASFNTAVGNNDEYQASVTAPAVTATTNYSYTYRFTLDDGVNYTYCDTNGAGSNAGLTFEVANLGVWTVNP